MSRQTIFGLFAVLTFLPGPWLAAVEPGDKAPDFAAQGIDGKQYSLRSANKETELLVLCFTGTQCPVAGAYEQRLIAFNKEFSKKGVLFIAVNCDHQADNLKAMGKHASERGFNFPFVLDASGDAARNYGARVTPEFYVIHKGTIAYHGAFDNELNDPTKHYVADAVSALLSGKAPPVSKTKAFGCRIQPRE